MSDWKTPLRLVEQLDKKGNIEDKGVDKLVDAVQEASDLADNLKCEELVAFATSAVRSATNCAAPTTGRSSELRPSLDITRATRSDSVSSAPSRASLT